MTTMVTGPGLTSLVAPPDPHTSAGVIGTSLATLRRHLGMDVAFVGRFVDGRRRFEYVDTGTPNCPVEVGASDPVEATYCARVLDGRLPELVRDAAEEPSVADLAATRALPVGAHLSVPLRRADGQVIGTLCCFSHEPDPSLRDRDIAVVRMFSDLIGTHLEALLDHEDDVEIVRTQVRSVIDDGGPMMALQPIVDLESGRVVGHEALARFTGPLGRNPQVWFTEAHRAGLGAALECSAVNAALRLLPQLPGETTLAVNVSAATLFAPGLVDVLTGEHAGRLVIELTEHDQVDSYDAMSVPLTRLREAGARVAVDDAGSGYAGLHRILHLQPEILKLDRTLVTGLADHAGRRAMVEAMVGFAGRVDATVVAEGVETAEDLEVLRHAGVRLGQGYHLGRPTLDFAERMRAPAGGHGPIHNSAETC